MRNPFAQNPTPAVFDVQVLDEVLHRQILDLAKLVAEIAPDEAYHGREPRLYVVGGCVRDVLLGLHPKDADVEVFGVAPEKLEGILRDRYPDRIISVGRSFGILKICLDDGFELDVSVPRRESKHGLGHQGFLIQGDPAMPLDEAARRRDFTVNALLADPLTGEIHDFYGGKQDLESGILRVVDSGTFQDDPLRVYRAIQFAARFDMTLDAETEVLLCTMVQRGTLSELSKERITDELVKLFVKAPRPSVGFELMRRLGIVERYYPEVAALIGTPQEPEWHPEGDVWTHTLLVIDEAARLRDDGEWDMSEKLSIVLGGLCHDLGKPATTRVLEGRIRSLGHEEAGVEPTRSLCARFSFPFEATEAAVSCAREHLKPRQFYLERERGKIDEASYVNAVRRLLKRIHPTSWKILLSVAEADSRGRGYPGAKTDPFNAGSMMIQVIRQHALDEDPKKPLLGGADLMVLFGLAEGPEIGKWVRLVEGARDQGIVRTRDEAIAWMHEQLSREDV